MDIYQGHRQKLKNCSVILISHLSVQSHARVGVERVRGSLRAPEPIRVCWVCGRVGMNNCFVSGDPCGLDSTGCGGWRGVFVGGRVRIIAAVVDIIRHFAVGIQKQSMLHRTRTCICELDVVGATVFSRLSYPVLKTLRHSWSNRLCSTRAKGETSGAKCSEIVSRANQP
ncbi:hypothetical protein BDQ12DRAFT_687514 [Crucibulum laeve]|uniref:Uncharacterized protein n=1 Tax=Crucibulum laeve TaxID=68775 RepID=A0A5C3LS53_9AGAR|nr:hypothetical protein BDQ12DRAFT_687514 [Crucibulum laeve]